MTIHAAPSLDIIRAKAGRDKPPYDHIDFVLVAKNEEARLPGLLAEMRPFFTRMTVAVQTSTDETLEIARVWADTVIRDDDAGFGDASMDLLQMEARGPWIFRVDADEMPTLGLLGTLSSATWAADQIGAGGVWIPYRSWIEDIEWEVPHSHLRLWRKGIPWPPLLHSRPDPEKALMWATGHIFHRKSIDEFVDGYLSYLRVGRGNADWTRHNREQLQNACRSVAERYGWNYIARRSWWPQVVAEAFDGVDPRDREEQE